MKYTIVIILGLIICCTNSELFRLKEQHLLICDPYIAELENKSRYIKLSGIIGNKIEAKYLATEQIHKYVIDDLILEINFYHRLISNQIPQDAITKDQLRKIKETKFGVIELILKSDESKSIQELSKYGILESIRIDEFENKRALTQDRTAIRNIPKKLVNIGANLFEQVEERKVLTLTMDKISNDAIIERLYTNNEVLYKYLNEGDIIEIQSTDIKKEIERSYILVDSFGDDLDNNSWCGMGPKNKRFECIYINNHDL